MFNKISINHTPKNTPKQNCENNRRKKSLTGIRQIYTISDRAAIQFASKPTDNYCSPSLENHWSRHLILNFHPTSDK